MMKSHLIDRLQQSIAEDGDSVISVIDVIDIVGGKRAADEYRARERLVRNIVRAKRQLKAPMSADFFRDIWPQALSGLLGKRDDQ